MSEVIPGSNPNNIPSPSDSTDWNRELTSTLDAIRSGTDKSRGWTFDMDDAPELNSDPLATAPVLREALVFFQSELHPVWKETDSKALKSQSRHKIVANLAIWSGVAAVAMAILQLVLAHVLPTVTILTTILEFVSIVLAAITVMMGITLHFHHNWLSARQSAERLRSLKFQSLAWHELWCDLDAWKTRVREQINKLRHLSNEQAERWATESDSAAPDEAMDPGCPIPPTELRAIADYYRIKRLEFQKNYFDLQSNRANRYSWAHHWKLSLVIFFASVIIVLMHGVISLALSQGHAEETATTDVDHHSFWHIVEFCLIGLAALLPVIGFGVRAWMSAFEFPRSRNLFRAKSLALDTPIAVLKDSPYDETDSLRVLQSLSHSEYFLITEHREWCRLQIETEWFL
ncbi:hypothetical protein [Stieleria varia]|uniref:SMODS and SLOG-associating 2TM effector domain-containing protein n=1 Tax=Stieleria varia TaxID=2528005 RepID=A0A5C6ARZ5_9BACT|nr:hypothetical protein [Stieleria varia]TWU02755.1 hypothetical protein Pla52n_38140 [Stieleria varia]